MDQNELEEPHDDDVVEITHLNQDDEAGRHQPSSHQPRILDWMLIPPWGSLSVDGKRVAEIATGAEEVGAATTAEAVADSIE